MVGEVIDLAAVEEGLDSGLRVGAGVAFFDSDRFVVGWVASLVFANRASSRAASSDGFDVGLKVGSLPTDCPSNGRAVGVTFDLAAVDEGDDNGLCVGAGLAGFGFDNGFVAGLVDGSDPSRSRASSRAASSDGLDVGLKVGSDSARLASNDGFDVGFIDGGV